MSSFRHGQKRVDGNQAALVKVLRQYPGVSVAHTHMIGKGAPDIIVGYRGRNYWFEVKDPSKPPSKRKLTIDEKSWHLDWTGHSAVVTTVGEIFDVLNADWVGK